MDRPPTNPDLAPAALLERARALQPLLVAAAPRIEAGRQLPPDVLDALHDAGLFRLLIPRALGGAEADLLTLARVIAVIAQGDASCAWCLGQAAGCAMAAAHLPPQAAWEAFGRDRRAVLAWGAGVSGEAVRDGQGWRISGRWLFASGGLHATMLGGQCPLAGRPAEVRTFIFPRAAATLTGEWQVIGLRGTGSHAYVVTDLHVPDAYCFDRTQPVPQAGALYRVPLGQVYPIAFGAVGLGIARAMLDALMALATDKTPRGAGRLRDNAALQGVLGHLEARWRAAQSYLHGTARDIWADLEAGYDLSAAHSLDIRMSATHAIQESLAIVDAAYHEAGATAIFDSGPFERRLRDMHAVAQQIQGRRANFELAGQHMLGITDAPLFT